MLMMDGERFTVINLDDRAVIYEGSQQDCILFATSQVEAWRGNSYIPRIAVYAPVATIFIQRREPEVKFTLTEQGQKLARKR